MVGGELLKVSSGGCLSQLPALPVEPGAVKHYVFGCLLLPPTEAGRRLEAWDPACVQEVCQADLSCAELGEETAVWLREAGV